MIGILGDPNSGKSVFSRVLGCLLELHSTKSVWVYDCDAAALTSDWYVYGLQRARSQKEASRLKQARESIKQKWTEYLESKVLERMQNVKKNLEYIVADFPGGYHDEGKGIHKRIPDAGRADMLRCCDYFVIISRSDNAGAIGEWKSALDEYGLQGRVIAELLSQDPDRDPAAESCCFDGLHVFHAAVCGLNRNKAREDIVTAFDLPFQEFTAAILSLQ